MGGKIYFNAFSRKYRWVIILYINCGQQGAIINMQGIEIAFKCALAFYFHFQDSLSHILGVYYGATVLTTYFTRLDICPWCSGSANHSPLSYQ